MQGSECHLLGGRDDGVRCGLHWESFGDHFRKDRFAGGGFDFSQEVGQSCEVMGEDFEVAIFEVDHFSPCALRKFVEEKDHVVIGDGCGFTARG